VESSLKHNFLKWKEIQIRKFLALKDLYQTIGTLKAIHGSEKSTSVYHSTFSQNQKNRYLWEGLIFAVTNRVSNLDTVCAAEVTRFKVLPAFGMEFRWWIQCMFENSRLSPSSVTRKEPNTFKSLRDSKEIRILQAEKENCTVVLNVCTYKKKISSLLESGVYEIQRMDSTSQTERKTQKVLT
jgi:hypothetical protein